MRQHFRYRLERLKSLFGRHRASFMINLAAGFVVALTIYALSMIGALRAEGDLLQKLTIFLLLFVIILLGAISITIRRRFNIGEEAINQILYDTFGYTWQNNQFFIRKTHFTAEKDTLGKVLIDEVLPKLLAKIAESSSPSAINVIIDSGTTLSPLFKYLPDCDIKTKIEVDVAFHTNNLAGIDELYCVDSARWRFKETDFFLIDGHPLGRYRATTYEERPHPYLSKLWKESRDNSIVTVGVLTANWILGGSGLNRIALCAKGTGHPEFKQEVVDNCDYLVVVAPLGKILRLASVNALNNLVPEKEGFYRTIEIPEAKRSATYLLSTFRSASGRRIDPYILSPLVDHSANLLQVSNAPEGSTEASQNFLFWQPMPTFNPPGRPHEVAKVEVPHEYLRGKSFQKAYNVGPWRW